MIRRQAEAGRLQIARSRPRRATPQGHEPDPAPVQAIEMGVRRQLRIEHQLLGRAPRPALPEVHELQDLVGLLRLGDARVGIAEDPLGGIAGEEDQDALLAATAAGDVVLLQRLLLSVGRDGVEIEVERPAPRQADAMHLVGPGVEQPQGGAAIDPRAIRGQVRALGDDVEAGEQGDPLVTDQVHDMALALLADELEGQEGADGLLGGDRGRAGEIGPAEDVGQADVAHQRDEEPEAAEPGSEGARLQAQGADVRHGGRLGAGGLGPFLVEAPGQAREALLAEEDREGVDADVVPGGGQLAADVVDGEVPLPHGDDQIADAIARRRRVRPLAGSREEGGALGGVVAELVAEDAEGPRCVAEAASDLVGGESLDEVGTEGFVLSLERRFGS